MRAPILLLLAAVAAAVAAGPARAASEGCGAPLPIVGPMPRLTPGPGAEIVLLAIGSSSTEGAGASGPAASYPAVLERLLRQRLGPGVRVGNAGRGGERAEGALARLPGEIDRARPRVVLWQAGANDGLAPAGSEDAYAATLARGIALIRRAGAGAVLIDAQALEEPPDPARYARFVARTARVARATGTPLVARHAWMAGLDGAARAALMAPDRLHMNDRGYACLAAAIADAVAPPVRPGAERARP